MSKQLIFDFDNDEIKEVEKENSLYNWCLKNDKHYILDEWDYSKNMDKTPKDVAAGTEKKYWWKCKTCGYEWFISPNHRKRGDNCPKCGRIKCGKNRTSNLLANHNLTIDYPEILDKWDYENNEKGPENYSIGSKKKLWWKCDNGHRWESTPRNILITKYCPYCFGRYAIEGENDLLTLNPDLAKEWNYEKNGDLRPNMVKAGSTYKVWWKCEKGHEWQATITNRTKGRNCPFCSNYRRVSIPEKIVYFYINNYYEHVEANYKLPSFNNMEFDIYIPANKIAIEYDGVAWHSDIARDKAKDELASKSGINLIRIREKNLPNYKTNAKFIITKNPTEDMTYLKDTILELFEYINKKYGYDINPIIDIRNDYPKILEIMNYEEKSNSLETKFPDVAKEWNYEKNGELKPSQISPGSSKLVWWKCEKGHEWQNTPANRTNKDNMNNCPYCKNKKVWPGFNDLVTINPKIASQWNYEKNGDLKPTMVTIKCSKNVWWKCEKGHEWQARIYSREKSNCPYCGNKKVIIGENDLCTTHPDIAKEWHPTKNGELKPEIFTFGSNKKVWWICHICGFEFEAMISSRTGRKNPTGCINCYNNKKYRNKL